MNDFLYVMYEICLPVVMKMKLSKDHIQDTYIRNIPLQQTILV